MEDRRIVELYWQQDESAIAETEKKHGKYLHRIACRILQNKSDAEECVNDTCRPRDRETFRLFGKQGQIHAVSDEE